VGEPALRGRGVEEVERALRGRGGRDQAGELRMVEVPRRRGGRGRRRRRRRGRAGGAVAAVLERRDPRERALGGSGRRFHGTKRAEAEAVSGSAVSSASLVLGDAGQMRMAGSNGKTGPDVDFFIYFFIL
jgi:hypothetical protein